MNSSYSMPEFLEKYGFDQQIYTNWIKQKARSHFKRDEKKLKKDNKPMRQSLQDYTQLIHEAVIKYEDTDPYTGDRMKWNLIGLYNGVNRRDLLCMPTIDHVWDNGEFAEFIVCSWKTNDAKSDLSKSELIEFCKKVVIYNQVSSDGHCSGHQA